MPALFDKHGLYFQYPENWELQESYAKDKALEIYITSPNNASWSVMLFDREMCADELVREVVSAIKEQYEGVEIEAAEDTLFGVALQGYDSNFFCLDLLVTNWIRAATLDDYNVLFVAQAESREFDEQRVVFDAITTSFLMSACGPKKESNTNGRVPDPNGQTDSNGEG